MSSEENQKEEQITVEPEQKVEKIKDPKKVAAGKRLAEYHKKAKAALKESKETKDDYSSSWFPDISFGTAVGIVGIGLTAADLYFRFKKPTTPEKKNKPNLETIKEEPKLVKNKSFME